MNNSREPCSHKMVDHVVKNLKFVLLKFYLFLTT